MSVFLDVAIGVVFLYLLLALVVTTLQELIASVLRLRARDLYANLERMLVGTVKVDSAATGEQGASPEGSNVSLIGAFYSHPLIQNLMRTPLPLENCVPTRWQKWRLPSYIPSKTFVLALLDVLRGDSTATRAIGARKLLDQASATVDNLSNESLKRVLLLWTQEANDKGEDLDERVKQVSDGIESWFNDRMARASGWYKRKAQWWSLVLSLGAVVASNSDTLHVANCLWQDANLRAAVVESAQAYHDARVVKEGQDKAASALQNEPAANAPATAPAEDDTSGPTPDQALQLVAEQTRRLASVGLPIGWSAAARNGVSAETRQSFEGWGWFFVIVGWLITALAVSLGANFWFDLLGKALQLRGAGPKVSPVTGAIEAKES